MMEGFRDRIERPGCLDGMEVDRLISTTVYTYPPCPSTAAAPGRGRSRSRRGSGSSGFNDSIPRLHVPWWWSCFCCSSSRRSSSRCCAWAARSIEACQRRPISRSIRRPPVCACVCAFRLGPDEDEYRIHGIDRSIVGQGAAIDRNCRAQLKKVVRDDTMVFEERGRRILCGFRHPPPKTSLQQPGHQPQTPNRPGRRDKPCLSSLNRQSPIQSQSQVPVVIVIAATGRSPDPNPPRLSLSDDRPLFIKPRRPPPAGAAKRIRSIDGSMRAAPVDPAPLNALFL
jgi:hypothetical protein